MGVNYGLIADGSGKVPDDESLVIADVSVNGQLGLARNLIGRKRMEIDLYRKCKLFL